MPNRRHKPEGEYPEHVERVTQTDDDKGILLFSKTEDWQDGDETIDHIYMAAEAGGWVHAEAWR